MPFIDAAGELKTKPTQHSVNELRRIGIHPDVVVCRSTEPLSDDIREKIALFADVDRDAVIGCPDVPDVYLVPEVLQAEGLDALVCEKLGLDAPPAELGEWAELVERTRELREDVEIALVGKYVKLHDAYLSVHEALKHAGVHAGCRVHVRWVDAENMSYEEAVQELEQVDGVLVPGGFGSRGWEGKILACQRRTRAGDPVPRHLPRHARRRLRVRPPRLRDGRRELDGDGPRDAVPGDRPASRAEGDRGSRRHDATRRAGGRARGGHAVHARRTAEPVVHERHRHRYEVNNELRQRLVDAGLVVSGTFQEGRLVEIVELPDHPWFVASQFHPEFKSRPTRPAPLFREFVAAARERARSRTGLPAATSAGG